LATIYRAQYLVPGDAPPVEGGAFLAEDGMIAARGTLAELQRAYPEAPVVDFGEAIIAPLLVNAHTHLELTDFPRWAAKAGMAEDPSGFVDWILRLIKTKKSLVGRDYQLSVANGIEQSLAYGVGTVGDILAYYPAREAYRSSSLDGLLFLETLGQDPALIRQAEQRLDQALKEGQGGRVEVGLSPHSPYTIRGEYLERLYRRCRQQGLRCSTHLAESPDEVEFIEHGRGPIASCFYPFVGWENYLPPTSHMRPVAYLDKHGGFFQENLLVHGVQLNDDEIELLARKGMHLALCPRSNAKLKVGRAPAGKLLNAGVNLCLGTDSLASCDSLSIWDEMAFAARWFRGELDAPTLFAMATSGGARALGLHERLGTLGVGKQAGFQILKPKTKVAAAEIFDYFISPGCGADIAQVYHHGRAQLSGLDP